ncbi:MAG: DUF4339 domain-containing protein [Planctomycetia bacterium]
MSSFYAKVSGKVYGPFTREQLMQMASSGRVNAATEVSADRNAWSTAGALLGLASGPEGYAQPAAAGPTMPTPSRSVTIDCSGYLQILRNHSRYPFYRTSVLVAAVVGYMTAAAPVFIYGARIIWFGLSSFEPYELVGAAVASGLLAILVTVLREVASMFADLVDSTLDHHARVGS